MYFSYHVNRFYCLTSWIAESESRCPGIYWSLSYRKDSNVSSWAPPRLEYTSLDDPAVLIRSASDPCVLFVLPDYMLKLATYFTNVGERWVSKGVRLDLHSSIILRTKTNEWFFIPKGYWELLKNTTTWVRVPSLLKPIPTNSDVARTGLGRQMSGVHLTFRKF